MSALALGVRAPGEPAFFEVELAPLEVGRFRVATLHSGVSAGTELTFVKGTNPFTAAAWDEELGVFRHDRAAVGYPVERLGYMEVGRVEASRARAVAEGALVAMAYGHRSAHVADAREERWVLLSEELDPVLGIYVAHMGPICANGLLHAAAESARGEVRDLGEGVRGRCVLVCGAGVVGLLTALFCAEAGAAQVAVLDGTPERLAAARALGLWALDEGAGEGWELVKESWRHGPRDRGADVAFQCRGRPAALAEALRCLRPQGVVIDLAFYPGGAEALRLGEEFHHNGMGVRCAQIGRVPRGLAHAWDRERLSRETLALLRARGEDVRAQLVTDRVPFASAPELLADMAARRRHVLQAVLDF